MWPISFSILYKFQKQINEQMIELYVFSMFPLQQILILILMDIIIIFYSQRLQFLFLLYRNLINLIFHIYCMQPTSQFKHQDKPVYYSSVGQQNIALNPQRGTAVQERVITTGNVGNVTYNQPGQIQTTTTYHNANQVDPGRIQTRQTRVYHEPGQIQSRTYHEGGNKIGVVQNKSYQSGQRVQLRGLNSGNQSSGRQTRVYQEPGYVETRTTYLEGGNQAGKLQAGSTGQYETGYVQTSPRNTYAAGTVGSGKISGQPIAIEQRQITQENERPYYKKVYSNKTSHRRQDGAEGAVGGGYSEDSEGRCKCCSPLCLGLLLCLGLVGLILGLLFGLGVIGGNSDQGHAAGGGVAYEEENGEGVFIDGATYSPNSVTVQTTTIAQDEGKSSGGIYMDGGDQQVSIDGVKYSPNSISVKKTDFEKSNPKTMAAISAATGAAGAASLAGLLFNNEDDEKTTIGGVQYNPNSITVEEQKLDKQQARLKGDNNLMIGGVQYSPDSVVIQKTTYNTDSPDSAVSIDGVRYSPNSVSVEETDFDKSNQKVKASIAAATGAAGAASLAGLLFNNEDQKTTINGVQYNPSSVTIQEQKLNKEQAKFYGDNSLMIGGVEYSPDSVYIQKTTYNTDSPDSAVTIDGARYSPNSVSIESTTINRQANNNLRRESDGDEGTTTVTFTQPIYTKPRVNGESSTVQVDA